MCTAHYLTILSKSCGDPKVPARPRSGKMKARELSGRCGGLASHGDCAMQKSHGTGSAGVRASALESRFWL
jgi:hypothetical protein